MILKHNILQFPRKTSFQLFTKNGVFQQSTGIVMKNFPGGKPPDPRFFFLRFYLALASLPTRISSKKGLLCTLIDSLLLWHLEMTTFQRYLGIAIHYIPTTLCRKNASLSENSDLCPPKTMFPRRHWAAAITDKRPNTC